MNSSFALVVSRMLVVTDGRSWEDEGANTTNIDFPTDSAKSALDVVREPREETSVCEQLVTTTQCPNHSCKCEEKGLLEGGIHGFAAGKKFLKLGCVFLHKVSWRMKRAVGSIGVLIPSWKFEDRVLRLDFCAYSILLSYTEVLQASIPV